MQRRTERESARALLAGAAPRLDKTPAWWSLIVRTRVAVLLLHASVFTAAYALAFLARFEFEAGAWARLCLATLPLAVGFKLGFVGAASLLRGPFRYVGLRDMACALEAVSLAAIVLLAARGTMPGLEIPRSVILIDWAFALLFYAVARGALRLAREGALGKRRPLFAPRRAVILGAGDGGEMLLRDILAHPEHGLEVTALLDDDRETHGQLIHRVPVLGGAELLPEVARRTGATLALVAMPAASGAERRRVVRIAQDAGIECKTLPSLCQLANGHAVASQVRPVEIEDLLGRPPVETDLRAIGLRIRGRSVVVTGASGSIGSELCRQIAAFEPGKLVLLDRNETGLFWLARDLAEAHPALSARFTIALGDVTDRRRMREVFRQHAPALVFHAAAYKHVPIVEENPAEALKNNVFGTMIAASEAEDAGVETFVLISTDKAVAPSSLMGASKRLCELHLLARARDAARTRFVSVRFGNVLGSVGSVVPIFQRQIQRGGPVTITHRAMKRFFMTVREAVQLVLQAAEMGRGGEIFVLDMGEQVKVHDLAHDLIRLSGLRPHEDIRVVETGVRPGEKLEEALHADAEDLRPTAHARIRVLANTIAEPVDWNELQGMLESGGRATDPAAAAAILSRLLQPQHAPPVPLPELAESPFESVTAAGT